LALKMSLAGGFNSCQRAALDRTGSFAPFGCAGLFASSTNKSFTRRCRSPPMMRKVAHAQTSAHMIQSHSILLFIGRQGAGESFSA